jgi:hypothetical protein
MKLGRDELSAGSQRSGGFLQPGRLFYAEAILHSHALSARQSFQSFYSPCISRSGHLN